MSSQSNKSQMRKNIIFSTLLHAHPHWFSLVKKLLRLDFNQKIFQPKEIKIET